MAETEESLFLSEGEGEYNSKQQVSGIEAAPNPPRNFFDECIEEQEARAFENAPCYKPSEEIPKPYLRASNLLRHTRASDAPYVSPYTDDRTESGYGGKTGEGVLRRQHGDSTYAQGRTYLERPAPFSGEPGYQTSPPAQPLMGPLPASSTWHPADRQRENPNPTEVCGKVTAEKSVPPTELHEDDTVSKPKLLACGRCLRLYFNPSVVKRHFPACIRKYGNPLGLRWVDYWDLSQESPPISKQASASTISNDDLLAQNKALQNRVHQLEAMKKPDNDLLAENESLKRRVDELEGSGNWDKPTFRRKYSELQTNYEGEQQKLRDLHWAVRGLGVHPHEEVLEEVNQLVRIRKQLAEESGEEPNGSRRGQPDPKRQRI